MKLSLRAIVLYALFGLLGLTTPASAEVLKIVVNDTIQPITDEYIGRAWWRRKQQGQAF